MEVEFEEVYPGRELVVVGTRVFGKVYKDYLRNEDGQLLDPNGGLQYWFISGEKQKRRFDSKEQAAKALIDSIPLWLN